MAMELLHCRIIPPQWACAALSSTPSTRFSALHCTAFNLNSCLCLRSSWLHTRRQKRRGRHLAVRALELDQDTLVAVAVGVVSIGVGIAIPVFYETQINNAATRENDQPCFPCKGTGARCNKLQRHAGFVWERVASMLNLEEVRLKYPNV